jgi:hypothetical protein
MRLLVALLMVLVLLNQVSSIRQVLADDSHQIGS